MIFDLWDKVDEVKDELSGGIAEDVKKAPLDQAQSVLMMIIGGLISFVSINYFPIHSFHISSIINLSIGVILLIIGFIWYGLHYS